MGETVVEWAARKDSMHTILVVDDQEVFRTPLVEALREQGYVVLEAGTAREAVEVATKKIPSLILLDIALPDTDGLELLRYFRGRAAYKTVPVILVTAHVRRDYLEKAGSLGIRDYLMKSSFSMKDMFARIEGYLGPIAPMTESVTDVGASSASAVPAAAKPAVQAMAQTPVFSPQKFLNSVELRAFPGTVGEIMQLAENPNASLSDVQAVLQRDPALAARILAASQTAALMRRTPTRSLEEAVQVLGTSQVVRIVASGAVITPEEINSEWGQDLGRLWSHSIACAFLSQRMHEPREEAFGFLLGLLHELPELLAILHLGPAWASLRTKGERAGWSTSTALGEAFKTPFPKLAREVLLRMRLPATLSASLRELYDLEEGSSESSSARPSTRIAQMAHHLTSVVDRPGSVLAHVGPVRDRDLAFTRSPATIDADLPRLVKEIVVWEELTGISPQVVERRTDLPRVLFYRGEGFASPDPMEALLRSGADVEVAILPSKLSQDADLKVVMAEPGTEAWGVASTLSGRVILMHQGRVDRPPARTVRTMRLPLSEAKLEQIFSEI